MLAHSAKMNAAAARRALAAAERRERRMARRADTRADGWRSAIERKVPQKAAAGIEAAFSKAFALLFESGSGLIERSCRSGEMSALYSVRDSAVDLGSGGAELRRLFGGICRSNLRVTALTSVEGLALGALGIGLPDIVIFLAVLLRGVYSTAMGYGFDCANRREKFFVLKLMQAALSSGEERRRLGRGNRRSYDRLPGTGRGAVQETDGSGGICLCRGYAGCQVYSRPAADRRDRRRGEPRILSTDSRLCRTEIQAALSAWEAQCIARESCSGACKGCGDRPGFRRYCA